MWRSSLGFSLHAKACSVAGQAISSLSAIQYRNRCCKLSPARTLQNHFFGAYTLYTCILYVRIIILFLSHEIIIRLYNYCSCLKLYKTGPINKKFFSLFIYAVASVVSAVLMSILFAFILYYFFICYVLYAYFPRTFEKSTVGISKIGQNIKSLLTTFSTSVDLAAEAALNPSCRRSDSGCNCWRR